MILLVNNGSYLVTIKKIITSCSCTEITSGNKQVIKSGDSLQIKVNYKPLLSDSLYEEKSIVIYTDGEPKLYTLDLKFFIKE